MAEGGEPISVTTAGGGAPTAEVMVPMLLLPPSVWQPVKLTSWEKRLYHYGGMKYQASSVPGDAVVFIHYLRSQQQRDRDIERQRDESDVEGGSWNGDHNFQSVAAENFFLPSATC